MIKKSIFLFGLLFLAQHGADAQASGTPPDSAGIRREQLPLTFTIHFRLGKSNVDTSYLNNAHEFAEMLRSMACANELYGIDSISILATASPEGSAAFNKKLINARAGSIGQYIDKNLPAISFSPLSPCRVEVKTWNDVREKVEADPQVPMRSEVLKILDSNVSEAEKESKLLQLGGNRTIFSYLSYHILRYMRQAVVVVSCSEEELPLPVVAPRPLVEKQFPMKSTPLPAPELYLSFRPEPEPLRCPLRIKTNGALLLMTVINFGAEVCLGEKTSLDLPLIYNPVTINRNWKFRALFFQPELRYWFSKKKYGHFVGLHSGLGWYNIAFFSDYRYQDKRGRTPIWNAGLSYGYAVPLTKDKKFGLEFTVGAGYNYTRYDMFYNISNGALHDTRLLSRWGITRAGINLTYNIK